VEDLYVTLGNYDLADGVGNLKIVINPMVDWIWFGFMMLAMGTGLALMPEAVLDRILARAPASSPSGTATGAASLALVLGLAVLLGAKPAQAQTPAPAQMTLGQTEAPQAQGELENWLVRNIMCQCGSCRHTLIECASENCGHTIQSRVEIHQLLGQGKGKEDIIQFFIQKYGSQVALASPIDTGFNRLAWALPYGVGVLAAGGLIVGARRLAKRAPGKTSPSGEAAAVSAQDPDLADKLEDELRNLD
jgi:cytochrome c-type biogenesis protein CcmH/NrfF